MFKLSFSWKFYVGASLVVLSFIIGAITHLTIIIYFNQPTLRWISIVAYIISWPMLIIGAWWAGKEYVESIKKYFSYRYYSRSVKKGTRRAYGAAKVKTKDLEQKAKNKTLELKAKTRIMKENAKNRTAQIKQRTRSEAKKLKEKARKIVRK